MVLHPAIMAHSIETPVRGPYDQAMAQLPDVAPEAPRIAIDELVLTRWGACDLDELAELHAEEETMAPFGGPMATRRDSDAYAERVDGWFDERGWGLFAVHEADGRLLGAVGLAPVPATIDVPFDNEVGWRLRRSAWGRGVASRSALAVLTWAAAGTEPLEVCSFTASTNARSAAVMRRIGLHRRSDLDFDHPSIPPGDPRRPHIVYASCAGPVQG